MAEVKIEIESIKLADLGIEQPTRYTPLRFVETKFIGYWINSDNDTIIFYLGAQTFLCRNCKKNIDIFESIIQNNGKHTDTQ